MKTALIFGASSGIGLEMGKILSAKAFEVYNASRTTAPEETICSIPCDVTRAGDIEHAVKTVLDAERKIDLMIYSAGYSMAAPVEYALEEDYRYLFEVNYFGAVKALKETIPSMRANGGGKIILVSSIGAVLPIAFDAFYSSSKAALDMLSRAANVELNPYNIYVSSVQVGGTCTRFTFKRNVYPEQEVGCYGEKMNKAAVALAGIEQGGMLPEESAAAVLKVLEGKIPPMIAGAGWKNKTFSISSKILPVRVADFINKNQYLQ